MSCLPDKGSVHLVECLKSVAREEGRKLQRLPIPQEARAGRSTWLLCRDLAAKQRATPASQGKTPLTPLPLATTLDSTKHGASLEYRFLLSFFLFNPVAGARQHGVYLL